MGTRAFMRRMGIGKRRAVPAVLSRLSCGATGRAFLQAAFDRMAQNAPQGADAPLAPAE